MVIVLCYTPSLSSLLEQLVPNAPEILPKSKNKCDGGKNETTADTGIGDVFEEPPSDFKPPSLPT